MPYVQLTPILGINYLNLTSKWLFTGRNIRIVIVYKILY